MTTREMATQYKLAQWSQIMQERTQSGQSIRTFCEQRGLRTQKYHYWQKKLREIAAQQIEQNTALVPTGWAAVEESKPEAQIGLILRVGGVEVEVQQDFNAELLAKVCRALSC